MSSTVALAIVIPIAVLLGAALVYRLCRTRSAQPTPLPRATTAEGASKHQPTAQGRSGRNGGGGGTYTSSSSDAYVVNMAADFSDSTSHYVSHHNSHHCHSHDHGGYSGGGYSGGDSGGGGGGDSGGGGGGGGD